MNKDWEKDFKRHASGNVDDEEIDALKELKEHGYEAMMKSVSPVRNKTFEILFEILHKEDKMTKHECIEMFIELGIEDYNRAVGSNCKNVNDVVKDMGNGIELSFTDVLSALQDRGVLNVVTGRFKCANAQTFLVKMGVDVDEL